MQENRLAVTVCFYTSVDLDRFLELKQTITDDLVRYMGGRGVTTIEGSVYAVEQTPPQTTITATILSFPPSKDRVAVLNWVTDVLFHQFPEQKVETRAHDSFLLTTVARRFRNPEFSGA